jgi:hypothetical protein
MSTWNSSVSTLLLQFRCTFHQTKACLKCFAGSAGHGLRRRINYSERLSRRVCSDHRHRTRYRAQDNIAEDPDNANPSKWHAIAKHVPNRTNKDCRKRWFAKMASDVVKGGWAPDEDEKLVKGIERYGTRYEILHSLIPMFGISSYCDI